MIALRIRRPGAAAVVGLVLAAAAAGCSAAPGSAAPFEPGTPDHPRPVVLVAHDYEFSPPVLDLVPGETIVLQVIDAGLEVHEAVVGPGPVQDAWESAEAPTVSAPPGPTAAVSVAPGLAGLRVVVGSGDRKDVVWTVPSDGPGIPGGWFVGCHIPGHWALGMVIPIRWIGPDGAPLATLGPGTDGRLDSPAP